MKAQVSSTKINSRLAAYWLSAGYILYGASHLPELHYWGGNTISLFQLYQLASLVLVGWLWLTYPSVRQVVSKLYQGHRHLAIAAGALLIWATISVVGNFATHGLYSVALLGAGLGLAVATFTLGYMSSRKPERLNQVVVWSGVGLALFSLWQFIGDNLGVSPVLTQILSTTHWTQIDFTRVNGLSIEPQFFTTVLLLPAALLTTRLFTAKSRALKTAVLSLIAIDTTVCLALSRGGFLAHGLLAAMFIGIGIARKQWKRIYLRIGCAVVGLCLALLLVGWSGSLPGHQGSRWVVYRYIEQASGGLIPLHTHFVEQHKVELSEAKPDKNLEVAVPQMGERDDVGVVNESATGRLDFYKAAVRLWKTSPRTMLFGIGWGNFGREAQARFAGPFTQHAIVNNQPLQILTELGLVGAGLALWLAHGLLVQAHAIRPIYMRVAGLGLLLALFVQLQFYSALHLAQIWFCVGLILTWSQIKKPRENAKVKA